jgi:hypothetical protein
MVSFITKLKTMTGSRPGPVAKERPVSSRTADPKGRVQEQHILSPNARSTQSISPKLRTFFSPQFPKSPKTKLSVLKSPRSPASPESAYSGVALMCDVGIVRRISKGKVKKIELSQVHTYNTASASTQTEQPVAADSVKGMLRRRSGLAKSGWEVLHSGNAGLLFMSNATDQKDPKETCALLPDSNATLPLTGNLLLKLQRAIAADASLQACQKRTAREIATIAMYQENLHKRKETLKQRLEQLKTLPGYELVEEKLEVDKELARVWEASIDTMDVRLKSEEQLERMREEFEGVTRKALAVLALGLAERRMVDVVGGRWRGEGSEGWYW